MVFTLLLHFSGGCCNISLVKMRQKTNRSSSFLKCMIPLLMLAVLFFGCGVLPPVISSISVSPSGKVVAETPVSISAEATSGSGLDLSYTWGANGGSLSSNTGKSIVWTAPIAAGVYIITLTVSDGTNVVTDTVNIVVVDPDAPIIGSIVVDPNPIATSKETTLTCDATDPGGEALSYSWTSPSGGTLLGTTGDTVKWRAPAVAGSYRITTTVTNRSRLSESAESFVEVVVPTKPSILQVTSSASIVDEGASVTLGCIAQDDNNLALTYSWSGSGAFSGSGSSVTWNAPQVTEDTNIVLTVTVSNGVLTNDAGTGNITITVKDI